MRKKKKRGESNPYGKFCKLLKDQLVRRLDGNYEKIRSVNGVAGLGTIHIVTAEGNSFWVTRDENGRFFERASDGGSEE